MDKKQSQKIVKDTLQSSFDKEKFLYFIKNLLNKVDEEKAFHARGYVPEAYKNYVKTYERLATYTDPDGVKIDVLIVYLQKDTSLERARTAQRNFVARYLKDRDQKDAGLVAFVSPDSIDWRFSLVKMDYKFEEDKGGRIKVKEEFTPAKRWSFLVGSNENSHTAQSKLAPIIQDDEINPTLKQLEEAFDIEKVTKEFFEKYRDLFLRVHETLKEVIENDPTIKKDFDDKNVNTVDFSKKLLGQIVFLYFLQKKGWFGVPMNKNWGDGDKKFLRTLFDKATAESKNYFNDYLEPLFYEALAKERDDDFYSRFECKIPFLNGGLFDPISNYDWVNTAINLPDDIFSNTRKTKEGDIGDGVLNIFDRYNFTVKEDEPLEKEVAIDPEMLGKVFENLLEIKDRKSKGTYYTPREIVHYMCEQSLLNYLATEFEGKISKEDIEKLIKHGESVRENESRVKDKGKETDTYYYKLPESIRKYAQKIDEKLTNVKICDPAIGSGAFLVGMMNEIVRTRAVLSSYINDPKRTIYNFKRDCIQNSLYGVDIDPGAVEIAKLRLWLSLVVDEDDIRQIKPLPNLDYKIMQGNSLVEDLVIGDSIIEFNLDDLVKVDRRTKGMKNLFDRETQAKLFTDKSEDIFDELRKLHSLYFEENNRNKKLLLKERIDEKENSFITVKCEEEIRRLKTVKKNTQDNKKIKKADQQILKIQATLSRFQKDSSKPFFLWKLHFADIFQENGGFDVVIANPPYLEARSPEFSDDLKKLAQLGVKKRWGDDSKYLSRGSDLLVYFYELGIYLIREKGVVVFITQNSWLDTDYGKKFQLFLLNHTNVKAVIDSDFKYFDSTAGPNINTVVTIFIGKSPDKDSEVAFVRFQKDFAKVSLSLREVKGSSDGYFHIFDYLDPALRDVKWGTILTSKGTILDLIRLLQSKGSLISDVFNGSISIGQGINLTKDYQVLGNINKEFPFLEGHLIPLMTSLDGAPFNLTQTKKFLIDGSKLGSNIIKTLSKRKIKVFVPSSIKRIPPILILPRGVSRHFCAVNSISAYSASAVEIYGEVTEEIQLNLWLFLNSSIAWLMREVSGRKNLGGGLLKAEATDLKSIPLYFEFGEPKKIKKIYESLQKREALDTLNEINTSEHNQIDELVFDYLEINKIKIKEILNTLEEVIQARKNKSKT